MNQAKVIDRIKKLLELSKSSNPNEAALAASRAADLMAEYELSEAQIRIVDLSPAGKICNRYQANEGNNKKRVAWHGTVLGALAKSMGCTWYWSGPNPQLFGRESNVQTVAYTYQYLVREIDRLAVIAGKIEGLYEVSGSSKSTRTRLRNEWKHSFYTGASVTIAQRLLQEIEEKKMQRKVSNEANSQALVLVKKDRKEVEVAYKNFSKSFGTARVGIKSIRRSDAYGSGKLAGSGVSLRGGGAALGSGNARLKGVR